MRQCWNWQTGTFEGRVSLTYGFKSHLPHQTLKNGSITKVEPFLFLILKIKYGIYSKTAAAATEFSQVLCENKKIELLNFLEILEELDKNERTDRQTIEQGVLADVALCSMNMERDAIQEMYEAGKISYGTSVSMKNDITLLELQME